MYFLFRGDVICQEFYTGGNSTLVEFYFIHIVFYTYNNNTILYSAFISQFNSPMDDKHRGAITK